MRSLIAINGAVPYKRDKQELEMAGKRIQTVQEPGANRWLWLRVMAYSKSINNPGCKSPGLSSEWSRRMLL